MEEGAGRDVIDSDPSGDSHFLNPYQTTAHRLDRADLAKMHELSVTVSWPHRPEDIAFLLEVGQGFVAYDEIGRVVNSAMSFPMGSDFAMIGMVMTAPRLQAYGAGRWLMCKVLEDCAGRDLRLNATRAAYRLYDGLGFTPLAPVRQHQGRVVAVAGQAPPPGHRLRPLAADDLPALVAQDAAAFGADRAAILAALLPHCDGVVLEHDGVICGFSLCRPFGRGRVIGPVVAETEAAAIALCAPHIARHAGSFLRLDTPQRADELSAFLTKAGLTLYDTVTAMTLGRDRMAKTGALTFGLISQALG